MNKQDFPVDKDLVTRKKRKDMMTDDFFKAVRLISYNPDHVRFYGSATFRAQPYPGDIDLYEKIRLCYKNPCDRRQALQSASTLIQALVYKIIKTPGVYLGDVKICHDRIIFTIVSRKYWGVAGPNKRNNALQVNFFDSKKVHNDLKFMLDQKLIDLKTYEALKKLAKPHITIGDFLNMKEILRNIVILRWTTNEILDGIKVLSAGRKISLEEALNDCKQEPEGLILKKGEEHQYSIVKPDVWIKVNGNYTEVSDLLVIYYDTYSKKHDYISKALGDDVDEYGKITNLASDRKQVINNLKSEVAKYYYSPLPKYHNMIKYAKRLYSLCYVMRDRDAQIVMNKLVYLWKSDYNLLNQVKSELDTIKTMLERIKKPPINDLYDQIQRTKVRLSQITGFELPDWVWTDLTNIGKHKYGPEEVIKILDKMINTFKEINNEGTLHYLKKVGLWPAPKKFLEPKNFRHIFA